MADLNETYDVDQRTDAIVNHQSGVLVCIAGPGTGKTFAFLKRVGALRNRQNATPDEICYLTFIKEISRAFSSDVGAEQQELSSDETHKPRISTLHSFACRLIRNQGFRQGFDGPLHFVSVADRNPRSRVFLSDLLPLVRRGELNSVPRLMKVLEKVKEAWRDNNDPARCLRGYPMYCLCSMTYRVRIG